MTRSGTDTMRLAKIYRRAAILMEVQPHYYACCGAIRKISRSFVSIGHEPEICLLAKMFKPRGKKFGAQWFGPVGDDTPENNEVRVLALCFMAAMVEAGDA